MYNVDELDEVVALSDAPQSEVGAPLPIIVADDYRLVLEYLIDPNPSWDGTYINVVGADTNGKVALIRFHRPYIHMMGAPNEEAIGGHPLAERGLEAFAAFEVKNSSWIRQLEKMNSVHPYHDRGHFLESKRHFIFAFHDSTFECIAHGFEVSILNGSILDSLETIVEMFSADPK
jgi:hypothetical protein